MPQAAGDSDTEASEHPADRVTSAAASANITEASRAILTLHRQRVVPRRGRFPITRADVGGERLGFHWWGHFVYVPLRCDEGVLCEQETACSAVALIWER